MLPDLDSNQNYQSQNLTYYHYTIGQSKIVTSQRLELWTR